MRELTKAEKEVLELHSLWLNSDGECGQKADLSGANLRGADLRGADLRYADLRYADLRYADLRGTNLRGTNLRYADLRHADLQKADLRNAALFGADLSGANLRYANLQYADLRSTNLREADLREADLDFASWPLWCGSVGVKADSRLVAQLMFHLTRLDVSECPEEVQKAIDTLRGMPLANLFCSFRDDVKPISRGEGASS